jgi:hypothetical protein
VAQRMRRHSLFDAGSLRRLMDRTGELAGRDGLETIAPRKQSTVGQHDVPALAFTPTQPQQIEQLR